MRLVRYFLPFLIMNVQAGMAATAPSVVVTDTSLYNSTPQETAQLVGLADRRFVAETTYQACPGCKVLGSIEFFAQPEPILPGICQVDVFDVHFKPHHNGSLGPVKGSPQSDIAKVIELHLFTLAKELPSPVSGAKSIVTDADRCHRVAIETDTFSLSAAKNVFSARSAEEAQRGSRLFAEVISAAAGKDSTLKFDLTCESSLPQCVKPRDTIGAMDFRHFESVETVDCGDGGGVGAAGLFETCLCVKGGGWEINWKMDITVRRDEADPKSEEIKSVRFGITLNPLF